MHRAATAAGNATFHHFNNSSNWLNILAGDDAKVDSEVELVVVNLSRCCFSDVATLSK